MTRLADGPLTGIRVIDLTTVVMGPYATSILGDMGADVIKVEPPQGDSTRAYRPVRVPGLSGSFLNANRNKRSIAMDLGRPAARHALARLIEGADVFVHNLRPAVIQRLGFDYKAVQALNPNIVYCSATGFGAEGPYAERPAYDDMIQAGSGFASLHVPRQGAPAYAPSALCDKLAGQAIVHGVLGALLHRERGGGGQAVEVPMFETTIAFNMVEHFGAAAFVPPLGPTGYARLTIAERRPYRTLDGYICILPYSDSNWRAFFSFIGREDLVEDPRFATLGGRAQVFHELYALVESEAAKRTNEQWLSFCGDVDIPCMPVISLDDVQDDPHVRAVDLFQQAEHPVSGTYKVVRSPIKFSAAPFKLRYHAPVLGQDGVQILEEAGLSQAEIEAALLKGGAQ
ncbi:CaiB/BaiF CoA transferase family protein [Pseudomonas chlororaphis]|uniref:CaiB/BaiF CoA transferase family protein n=1 Tax=Pseudomonas chlororaphis TaxID=587753 RepID=UPI001B313BAC|nr:CoA transferase [Pseudomonas chlororaphis]MBP5058831.1 CoA transferase [Pseudomonas chlororaphis]MBP5142949.1 CoA transferase [Pseudomonas chlororaphis]QTT98287.1 CoA transferase [Pseudomonas chlororaphis]